MRILTLLLALAPVAALADDCQDAVKAAYDKLAAAPAVKQTATIPGTPTLQMVMIGDILYMDRGDGQWTKLPLQPGMRAEMMQDTIPDASELTECRVVGKDAVDGADMTVYQYVPPQLMDETPGPQQLWIGVADGLPHRMTSEQDGQSLEMTMTYEDVKAPVE